MNRSRIVARLGGWSFVRLQKWLQAKTPEQADRIGTRLGRLAYRASKKHRLLTAENLARAFPEKTEIERTRLAKDVMVHFGRIMADFMRSSGRTVEDLLATTELSGVENLDKALAQGHGALMISAHFGNWERVPHMLLQLSHKVSIIARDSNDPEMTALVNKLREGSGIGLISRGDAAFPTIKRLKSKELVALLADQSSEECMIPFFGVPAGTVLGPAVLAERAKAPIVPSYCVRVGMNRYKMWIEPALEPVEGLEGAEAMMTAYNRSLEAVVRQYPEQYLWFHNRWKAAKKRGLA
jgi:KDO2-lipid IV(A) lauroyltransferase